MSRVIAVIQNKGGVGKTTVTSNLAAGLAKKFPDKRVLIIDMDGQGNQSLTFGIQPATLENTVYDVLVSGIPVRDAIIALNKTIYGLNNNLFLLPSNDDMNYYELDTLPGIQTQDIRSYLLRLKQALEPILDEYDYIFIDSPPELKIVAASIMMVAHDIYIPFEPDAYNAQGLIQLLKKIEVYKKQYNMSPVVRGVIPMKIRSKTRLHSDVLVQVDAYCKYNGIPVTKTRIPNSIKFPEFIASAQMPIVLADPNGEHSRYYFDLLEEVIGVGTEVERN